MTLYFDASKFYFENLPRKSPSDHLIEFAIREIIEGDEELFFDGSQIRTEGVILLSKWVATSTTLKSISFTLNHHREEWGAPALCIFFGVLESNSSLTSMTFRQFTAEKNAGRHLRDALLVNVTLKKLDLTNNELGPEDTVAIAEALKVNTVLKSLDLTENPIKAQGANALFKMLQVNTTLESLGISWWCILDDGGLVTAKLIKLNKIWTKMDINVRDKPFVKVIAKALSTNTLLTTLNLRGSTLDAQDRVALIKALKINTTLEKVDLKWSHIVQDGGKTIGELIRLNKIWNVLHLWKSKITWTVAVQIAEALKVNTFLKTLDLGKNPIRAEGAMALAEGLRENKGLEKVFIPWSEILDDEGIALAELLKLNKYWSCISFQSVPVSTAVLHHLFQALQENTVLKHLDLSNCSIGNDGAIGIAEALRSNSALEVIDLSGNLFDVQSALLIFQELLTNRVLKGIALPQFPTEGQTLLASNVLKNEVLLECRMGFSDLIPRSTTVFWKKVQCDCIIYHQLCAKYIGDCDAETWSFARALFRARK